jgi:hypothetical protein
MNSSLAFGRPSSSTCCACWTARTKALSTNWTRGTRCGTSGPPSAYDLFLRFREISPFGLDGIRKITSNPSELKKMTAHDYEDLLQVGASKPG